MAGLDMHVHSTASDGLWEPEQIITYAREHNLDGIAITDHDTVANLSKGSEYAKSLHFPFIPGVEISAEINGRDVHILGYWIDYTEKDLIEELEKFQTFRHERCWEIVDRLAKYGIILDAQSILAESGASTGRPHIAKAMVEAGYVENMREAFQKWLSRGLPAYVPRKKYCPFKAIETIRRAGGAPVVAHPGIGVPDNLLVQLARKGLAGVEAYHPDHNRRAEQKYLQFARLYRIAATGGSDYHGNPERPIGFKTTSLRQLELLARLK